MKKTKMKAIMGIAVAMAMTVSSLTACGGTKETKAATEAAAETTANKSSQRSQD